MLHHGLHQRTAVSFKFTVISSPFFLRECFFFLPGEKNGPTDSSTVGRKDVDTCIMAHISAAEEMDEFWDDLDTITDGANEVDWGTDGGDDEGAEKEDQPVTTKHVETSGPVPTPTLAPEPVPTPKTSRPPLSSGITLPQERLLQSSSSLPTPQVAASATPTPTPTSTPTPATSTMPPNTTNTTTTPSTTTSPTTDSAEATAQLGLAAVNAVAKEEVSQAVAAEFLLTESSGVEEGEEDSVPHLADAGLPDGLDAFVIDGLLSARECADMIAAAEVSARALSHWHYCWWCRVGVFGVLVLLLALFLCHLVLQKERVVTVHALESRSTPPPFPSFGAACPHDPLPLH
jgi:hypothetical protein